MKTSHSPLKGVSGALVAVLLIGVVVGVVFLFPGIFRGGFGGGTIGLVGPGSAGIVIKSFSVDSPTTETNIPITFTLVVENIGERNADKIKAELFGLSSEWKATDSQGKPKPTTFPLNFGSLDGKATLGGADPANKIPGEATSEDLTLVSDVKKDTDTPYTASTRVAYTYDTIIEGSIRVVNREYARTQGATTTQGSVTARVTNGPLTIAARTRTTLVGSDISTPLTLIFDITNRGGGRPFDKSGDSPTPINVDKIFFTTSSAGGTTIKCGSPKDTTGTVKLINSIKTLTCEVKLGKSVTTFEDIPFKIDMDYKYFVSASTSVTLLKTIGGTESAPAPPPSGGGAQPL